MRMRDESCPPDEGPRLAWGFAQGAHDAVVQGLDAILLFLTDLGLGFHYVPKLDDIILDLLNVDVDRDVVATRYFFHVGLEFPDTFAHDF